PAIKRKITLLALGNKWGVLGERGLAMELAIACWEEIPAAAMYPKPQAIWRRAFLREMGQYCGCSLMLLS
ncbi:MAG: hypothetical protein MK240_04605, partial [Opitutales bacterium]|nr:hypothetical protein [Opitutales bacterium]